MRPMFTIILLSEIFTMRSRKTVREGKSVNLRQRVCEKRVCVCIQSLHLPVDKVFTNFVCVDKFYSLSIFRALTYLLTCKVCHMLETRLAVIS